MKEKHEAEAVKALIKEYSQGLSLAGRSREASAFEMECALMPQLTMQDVQWAMDRAAQGMLL